MAITRCPRLSIRWLSAIALLLTLIVYLAIPAPTADHDFDFISSTAQPTCLAASPDETWFVVGDTEGAWSLWDVASRRPIRRVRAQNAVHINTIAVSGHGSYIASGDVNGTLRIWQASDHKLLHVIETFGNDISFIGFMPSDESMLLSVSYQYSPSRISTITRWDIASGTQIDEWSMPEVVESASLANHGKTLIARTVVETLAWNVETKTSVQLNIPAYSSFRSSVVPDANSQLLAAADCVPGSACRVAILDLQDGAVLAHVAAKPGMLAMSRNGNLLAVASNRGSSFAETVAPGLHLGAIGLYDVAGRQWVKQWTHDWGVYKMLVLSGEPMLIVAGRKAPGGFVAFYRLDAQ